MTNITHGLTSSYWAQFQTLQLTYEYGFTFILRLLEQESLFLP